MNGNIGFNGTIGGNVAGTGEMNGDISLPSSGGVTPEITMSAYVDNNTGVPSVNVSKSGTDEEPHFTLDFHNLKGATGEQGDDGYSPEITITPLTGGNRINITSEEYPSGQTFDVMNGQDGQDGQNGVNGVSPVVTITEITGGHEVNITDVDHPSGQSFDVLNGENGQNGENGYSPAVSITEITGGHQVNITDFLHPSGQTFDVMDGEQGEVGEGVPQGGSTGQFLKKSSNTDYDTEWSNINASDVVYDNTSSGLTSIDVQGAIDEMKDSLTDLIKFVSYEYTYSINANTSMNLTRNDFGISTPTGYTPLAIYRFNSGSANVYARNVNVSPTTTTVMSVRNISDGNINTLTALISIAYIKSNFVV